MSEKAENTSVSDDKSASSSTSSIRSRTSSSRIREKDTQSDRGRRNETKLTPFYLRWSFGMNNNIPTLNLTSKNRSTIFYASCHAGVLYDYKANEMRLLQGHQHAVTSIASDESGKWIVTADAGEDNVVIVWDSESCLPVCTLFNPHPKCGSCLVGISTDAKYVLTVGHEMEQSVTFWLWTLGKDKPDGILQLQPSTDKVKHVIFSPDKAEHFMLTSDTNVYFGTWNDEELSCHVPEMLKRVGHFTESVYQRRTHQALTATSNGSVIVWSDESNSSSLVLTTPFSNIKNYMKAVRLEKEAINVIRSTDNYVVTGNTQGHIRFYDQYLKILYWCQNFKLSSLTAINFHLNPRQYHLKESLDCESVSTVASSIASRGKTHFQESGEDEDHSEEYEQLYMKNVPSDATLERMPFVVRDFVVSTVDGHIGLVSFLQNKYEIIVPPYETVITAMDTHLEKFQLCLGNSIGDVCLYNYRSKAVLVKTKLVPHGPVAITSLKYAPSGLFLVSGAGDGSLWVLDPSLLTPLISTPYQHTDSPIAQLTFSEDSTYLGVKDEGMCVSLYQCEPPPDMQMIFMGKHHSHYKLIRDIMFTESSESPSVTRFFSLGEDRVLVEYDLANSQPEKLEIKSMERIEQSAIPLCMIPYPELSDENFILVSNSEHKFKIINEATKMCRKTSLGPKLDSPVHLIKMLEPDKTGRPSMYMIFASKKQIGIQMLPIDGNPFKSVRMIGHPVEITHMCLSPDNKSLFTMGKDAHAILMWTINIRAVEMMARIGGEGLNPYYCLIDGGLSGTLFQEMEDFFYYAQILHHGENSSTQHHISNKIPLCELPDLMRAIGFYPSEYEIENMIHEVTYSKYAETGKTENEIEFDDFVKLYVNHHPALGISVRKLENAFNIFATETDEDNNVKMTRDHLLDMLQERGECFSKDQTFKYMNLLLPKDELIASGRIPMKNEDDDANFEKCWDFVPEEITYSEFLEDVLGISLKSGDLQVENYVNKD